MQFSRIIYCCCFVFFSLSLIAQPPGRGGRPGGGQGPRVELAPGTGGMVGRVMDSDTEEPIILANVLVYQEGTEELVTGTTTDERGLFMLKDMEYGAYDVSVTYLGYETFSRPSITLSEDSRMERLGRVFMETSASTLDEVEVTAERSAVQFGLDRRVFNVEQDVASSGGTAEDLLRNIPSITVDLDGNISLRGSSNVRILINGKPSALTGMGRQAFLQQISAASIERVEVLTNPSAKYNPEGMAGIINIITKQQNRQGFNVQTSINIGTNDKYNGNVDLNYRVGKFNVRGGISYNDDQRWFRGDRFRSTQTADTIWYLDQAIRGDRHRQSLTYRGGVEYFLNKRGSLSFTGSYADQEGTDGSSRNNLFLSEGDETIFTALREETGGEVGEAWELMLDYRQRFRTDGQSLSFTAQRSVDSDVEQEDFFENQFLPSGDPLAVFRQENPQLDDNDRWLAQLDYTHPLGESMRLETGLRASLRNVEIDNQLFDFNTDIEELVLVDSLSNRFAYKEDVYSAYGIIAGGGEKWEWQAGLRLEQTYTESTLLIPTENTFENNYLSLFPSAYLTYKLDETNSVQASYSRRINRPRFRSLNPFIDYSDPLNPRSGNPYILPEFINSYELTYLRTENFGSITIGAYYREINDIITRISTADPETGVNVRSFANLSSGRNYGLEIIGTLRPAKFWQLVISGNGYRNEVDGSNLETDLNADGYQFSGRLQSSWTVLKDLGIQLTGFYRSPGVRPQGEMRAMYSIDFGLRKPVLKGKGTVTFRVTDIFNARRWSFITENNGIIDDATFQRESRIAYVGFTYSLRQDKRRGNRNRRERGGGGDDMEF